jgi:O-antigen biosynthesis protein WbqP
LETALHDRAGAEVDSRVVFERFVAMKRLFDILLALMILVGTAVPMMIMALLVKLTSNGPVLYWSDRVGRDNAIFRMPKFRTMRSDTPALATHLLTDPSRYLTPIGGFLRKSSLDELPQLMSILVGDMSFVGPRPALYNQDDLIGLRTEKGVHILTPGLTGWAQINGRDELPIPVKVDFDVYYLEHRSTLFDTKIIVLTALKVLRREGVEH